MKNGGHQVELVVWIGQVQWLNLFGYPMHLRIIPPMGQRIRDAICI